MGLLYFQKLPSWVKKNNHVSSIRKMPRDRLHSFQILRMISVLREFSEPKLIHCSKIMIMINQIQISLTFTLHGANFCFDNYYVSVTHTDLFDMIISFVGQQVGIFRNIFTSYSEKLMISGEGH